MKRYLILRDCCTSGNCIVCHDLPFGKKIQIEQTRTTNPDEAEVIASNWHLYNAFVRPMEVM